MPVLSFSPMRIRCGSSVDPSERPIELTAEVRAKVIKSAAANGGALTDRDVRTLQTLQDTWAGNQGLAGLIGEIERHGTVYVRML